MATNMPAASIETSRYCIFSLSFFLSFFSLDCRLSCWVDDSNKEGNRRSNYFHCLIAKGKKRRGLSVAGTGFI